MFNQSLFELTNPQKSIWSLEQFYKNTSVNNIGGTLIIKEKIDFDFLEKSINLFIKGNDSFNIQLQFDKDNSIKQFFSDYTYHKIDLINLNSYDDLLIKEKELVDNSFSLLNAPLFRFTMFKFPDNSGGIIMIIHHLISDAFSCNFAANKIAYIYNSFLNKKNIFPHFESYKEYINFENNYISTTKYLKDKNYWNEQFSTIPEVISLSTISSKTVDNYKNINSHRETFVVEKKLLDKINNFCILKKITKFNFFMAIYSLYIGKVTDTNDFVIGTPILNRTNFKEKNTSGMFINTIPFRFNLPSNITFDEYLSNIYTQTMNILRHQRYSYQYILDELNSKGLNVPKLYNILLSYQIGHSTQSETDFDYSVNWTHSSTNSDELDIHIFEYDDSKNCLKIAYDYQIQKFFKKDIYNLHSRILNIINQILYCSKVQLSDIELITPNEKLFILNNYNSNHEKIITDTVVDMFERQVELTPYNIAISKNGYSINYTNLNNMINYTSEYLKNIGISNGDKICLFYNNSIELIINIFALLKLSACYIPIDISYPNDRINYILENSNSKFILTNSNNYQKISNFSDKTIIINLEDILKNCKNTIFPNLKNKINLKTLAYIIYTSGSTGNPKGVEICHESLSNYINWCKDIYVKNDISNFPLYSSIAFDLTVTSVYTPLTTGNTLYIYEDSNPQLLLKKIIDDKKVQILKLTPAHLSLLQDIISNSTITKLIVGGDILSTEICKKTTQIFNNKVQIFNEYGPTEATVGCMTYTYSNTDDYNYSSVPIGIPATNTKIYLLNKDLNLIPFGYPGQIFIGGKCLSIGYLNLDNITKERFINSPFYNNEIIYSTGDIAKLFNNGIMEYIGRKDFQVKINGFRIEIGEIQSKIMLYSNIQNCYVTVININNTKLLCAYFVASELIDINDLKNFIMTSLPKYMIPSYFIQLESIPLTVNGKINKSLLPLPNIDTNIEYVAPATELEQLLSNIFIKLLKTEKISVTQNIFDYLIDSLTIIKIQTKLYALGISIDTQVFYNYPTIRDIANYITHKLNNNINNLKDIENINTSDIIFPINKINTTYNNILFFRYNRFFRNTHSS